MRIPDFTDLSNTSAEQPAPNAEQLNASWSNAGAPGAALEQFGQVAEKAGIDLKNINDVADVNHAMATQFQPKVDALAQNFYSLTGKAAVDAAHGSDDTPSYGDQVTTAMKETASGLSGSAQRIFLQAAQPRVDRELYSAAQHAGTQQIAYANESHDAIQANDLQDVQKSLLGGDIPSAMDGIKLMQQREMLYQKQLGNGADSDITRAKVDDLNNKIVQHLFTNLPADEQAKLGAKWTAQPSSAAPATGQPGVPKDLGADTVKPYTAQQVTDMRTMLNKPSPYDALFQKYGQQYGIDPQELKLHAVAESSLNPSADNGQAAGLMQLTAATAKGLGVTDRLDAEQSIMGAAKMMAQQKQAAGGNTRNADMLYYGGADQGQWGPNTQQYAENLAAVRGVAPGQYAQDTGVQTDAGGTISSTAPGIGAPPKVNVPPPPQVVGQPTFMGIPVQPQVASKLAEMGMVNKEHADKLQKINDESNFNQTQNDFFTKLHNNETGQGDQLTWEEIQKSNLPVQGPGGKEYWQEKIRAGVGKTDPEVFNTLLSRAQLPDGDPNKLTNPKELLAYVGHGITPANMNIITKTMSGDDEKEMRNQTLKVIKTQVSGEDKFPGMKDPKGEELYASAMPLVFKAIDDGKAKGIPTSQLYDPSSPNWVGNAAKPLIRPSDKWYSDLAAANMPDVAGAPGTTPADANKPGFWSYFNPFKAAPKDEAIGQRLTADLKAGKLPPQEAVAHIKDAYSHGFITREQAADLLVTNGMARKPGEAPAAAGPQVPRPE